jgi:hypothetical protein
LNFHFHLRGHPAVIGARRRELRTCHGTGS